MPALNILDSFISYRRRDAALLFRSSWCLRRRLSFLLQRHTITNAWSLYHKLTPQSEPRYLFDAHKGSTRAVPACSENTLNAYVSNEPLTTSCPPRPAAPPPPLLPVVFRMLLIHSPPTPTPPSFIGCYVNFFS